MSGTTTPTGNIAIIAFPGFGTYPGFGLFTPTDPPASAYTPFVPASFNAQSLALQQLSNNGLASIQATGVAEFNVLANLFSTWGQNQQQFATTVGDALATVANNSATACSGFFSCLF